MTQVLGQLKRLTPRTIWKNEARDFTPWLAENISLLGDVLGMDLEVTGTEGPIGDFAVDILAKDLGSNGAVVIENQFGKTDHDHLGKLLTYASGTDAMALVWIAEEIRDEHRQALEWLNERTDSETMLFAIVVEVLQIEKSPAAVNLKPVVFPNKWQKATKGTSSATPSPRAEAYRRFFQTLIDELREKHKFTGSRVAQPQNWFTYTSSFPGAVYGTSFAAGGRARVELYIDRGDTDQNKALFDQLAKKKEAIEAGIGASVEWERMDDRQASRIAAYRPGTILSDEAALAEVRQWMIETVLRFKEVFAPLLKKQDGRRR
ncbi:MAG: DUF4268 domain-containing protein [Armatimonadetes bacterium]|nr:DUF4268 domain-containing protein [Armatimonadota bacterium]